MWVRFAQFSFAFVVLRGPYAIGKKGSPIHEVCCGIQHRELKEIQSEIALVPIAVTEIYKSSEFVMRKDWESLLLPDLNL